MLKISVMTCGIEGAPVKFVPLWVAGLFKESQEGICEVCLFWLDCAFGY